VEPYTVGWHVRLETRRKGCRTRKAQPDQGRRRGGANEDSPRKPYERGGKTLVSGLAVPLPSLQTRGRTRGVQIRRSGGKQQHNSRNIGNGSQGLREASRCLHFETKKPGGYRIGHPYASPSTRENRRKDGKKHRPAREWSVSAGASCKTKKKVIHSPLRVRQPLS